ncbi:hypothetical protein BGZ94_003258 [Podila epigama]|nr:hypothetical protein BGZ94_003258 [Podila epigama]
MATTDTSPEDESILSFLTTDFLESQSSPFDPSPFFDSLTSETLLHPPSPPTSVGTFSESSGSPHNSNLDSCDEGSSSDVAMDPSPLDYWQYVYPDLNASSSSSPSPSPSTSLPLNLLHQPLLPQQQQQQPGAWPLLTNSNNSTIPANLFQSPSSPTHLSNINNNNNNRPGLATPPSPAASVKTGRPEKRTKRTKKQQQQQQQQQQQLQQQQPIALQPSTLPPLAPLVPLAPLKPLVSLAPQPTPPSPPISAHDTFIKRSPPLSPCIIPAPAPATLAPAPAIAPAPAPVSNGTGTGTGTPTPIIARRPSIVPALTPSLARSNPVVVKSSLLPEEKPQSDAVLTAQAKRQERLIKNRAAALLSRKRKREHINLLESHTDLLKINNQELKERVSELEDDVKVLTKERDDARKECERLHLQVKALTHRPNNIDSSSITRMDLDLERNLRTNAESERGLNSKATGVVFMIILFSFALFNLPSSKLETLMVGGGSLGRPRIGSSIVGRALDSYTKNPTISGQVREPALAKGRQDLNNMTDLVVFSDNRALQAWLGHQPVTIVKEATGGEKTNLPAVVSSSSSTTGTLPEAGLTNAAAAASAANEPTKSVGFVAQSKEHRPWPSGPASSEPSDPDRDAILYCANLLYSLDRTTVTPSAGPSQSTNGEFRRPRLSIISPLDGVVGSNSGSGSESETGSPSSSSSSGTAGKKHQLPPWMPNRERSAEELEQRYLRLDVEVTSSRVVSGKSLENHEQLIRFPLMPPGMFENLTTTTAAASTATSLEPVAKTMPTPDSSSTRPPLLHGPRRLGRRGGSNSRVNAQGGVTKTRRMYAKEQFFRVAHDTVPPRSQSSQDHSMPLVSIKEEPVEIYIKEEPMD